MVTRLTEEERTIFVLDEIVPKDTRHGDGTTREVRVVVHSVTNFNASRGVYITSQQGEYVVLIHDSNA